MAVRVDQVTQAKTGKSLRVNLGGQWYGAALDSGINGAVGQMIEAEIETGKYGPWIKKWVKSNAAPQAPAIPSAAGSSLPTPAGAAPRYAEPSDNLAPWYWPSVSNVCSAAIAHGLITKPEDLNMWALKWAQVAVATKEAVK